MVVRPYNGTPWSYQKDKEAHSVQIQKDIQDTLSGGKSKIQKTSCNMLQFM